MRTEHHFETTDEKQNKHHIVVAPQTKGYSWVIDGRDTNPNSPFYESDLAEKFARLRRNQVVVDYKGCKDDDGDLDPYAKQPLWSLEFIEKKETKRKKKARHE